MIPFLERPWALKKRFCKNPNITAKSSYQAKMCKKKLCKLQQIIHFEKPLTQRIKMWKTLAKFLKHKCVFKENWKCANSISRHLGSRCKTPAFSLKWGHVLVRKARKFELPSSKLSELFQWVFLAWIFCLMGSFSTFGRIIFFSISL